jgi:hypothetical protein
MEARSFSLIIPIGPGISMEARPFALIIPLGPGISMEARPFALIIPLGPGISMEANFTDVPASVVMQRIPTSKRINSFFIILFLLINIRTTYLLYSIYNIN